MKKIFFLCLSALLLYMQMASAQKMNFQGKIYYLGTPVTGTHVLQFYIDDLTPPWDEIDTVSFNNGLYALELGNNHPIPYNLFDSAHALRLMKIRFDGNPIDTVTLNAPFERDLLARSILDTGITWNHIHQKPTVDTSFTNEIQTISLAHDSLKLTQGGYVILPFLNDSSHTIIKGNLTVVDSTISHLVDIPSSGTTAIINGAPNQSIWQSFKAPNNGKLIKIKVKMYSSGPTVSIKVYEGYDPSGLPMGSGIYSSFSVSTSAMTLTTFDLSALYSGFTPLQPISFNAGKTYTFEIVPALGESLHMEVQDNPYSYGVQGTHLPAIITNDPSKDLTFSIDVDNTLPPCLTFGSNCYVGIGTSNPSAQLEVSGRIKDQSGFVMPVGTIVAFGGTTIPQGWLLCDGSANNRVYYSDLFEVIGTAYGTGDGINTFNVPDLRGRFARGVDGGSGNDPDAGARNALYGGNINNNIGSYQDDAFQGHRHNLNSTLTGTATAIPAMSWWGGSGYNLDHSGGYVEYGNFTVTDPISDGPHGSPRISNETRPKNVYVNYIIKW